MPTITSVADRRRIANGIIADALGIKPSEVLFSTDLGGMAEQVYNLVQARTGYVMCFEEGRRQVGHLAAQLRQDQMPVESKK